MVLDLITFRSTLGDDLIGWCIYHRSCPDHLGLRTFAKWIVEIMSNTSSRSKTEEKTATSLLKRHLAPILEVWEFRLGFVHRIFGAAHYNYRRNVLVNGRSSSSIAKRCNHQSCCHSIYSLALTYNPFLHQ